MEKDNGEFLRLSESSRGRDCAKWLRICRRLWPILRYWEKQGRRDGVGDEKRKIQKYSFQEDNSHKTLD